MLPDFERADRIGEFWDYPESRNFAELLIDREEDRTLRAVLVVMLREVRPDFALATEYRDAGTDSSTRSAIEAPAIGNSFEFVDTCIFERESGPSHRLHLG
jgi:hypothetical protein